jgi:hypothetical protein
MAVDQSVRLRLGNIRVNQSSRLIAIRQDRASHIPGWPDRE